MLVSCKACRAKHDFSILEGVTKCPACGASGEELAPISESAETTSTPDQPYTVLLAEDDSDMRETYRTWLADIPSWEVREATDGTETLAMLGSSVDILVLDRHMPDVSGPEVVDRLEGTAFDGEILVVSAYEQDEHLSDADVAGYLTKPIREETFIELLEQIAP